MAPQSPSFRNSYKADSTDPFCSCLHLAKLQRLLDHAVTPIQLRRENGKRNGNQELKQTNKSIQWSNQNNPCIKLYLAQQRYNSHTEQEDGHQEQNEKEQNHDKPKTEQKPNQTSPFLLRVIFTVWVTPVTNSGQLLWLTPNCQWPAAHVWPGVLSQWNQT